MQETHTHQQQHLVVQEMTDLHAHFTWSERERKSTMEKSTRKKDGQHIWHPYRAAFKGNQSEGRASVTCATGLITRHDFL
jgi:hypothetical protein